jgi:hypothetical protein
MIDTERRRSKMNKRILLTLASTAVFLTASAALAGGLKLDANTEVFQYGDSMYAWDPESGGAVRVCAVWDGFAPQAKQATALLQEGDYIVQRDMRSGETVKVGAVWDGAMPSHRDVGPTLALKR